MAIPTRIHGAIDYGVAGALAAIAAAPVLPTPVRRILAAAAASHTSYSALTDYEAGLAPVIGMRQHLALDTLAGAGICLSGLLMRRQPPAARAVLIAVGLTELAIVALSSAEPLSGPGQGAGPLARLRGATAEPRAGYLPLDTPKPVADGVWVVDSLMSGAMAAIMPVRMTILRLADGSLLLHSPTRFSHDLRAAIAAFGPVRHLVAPNLAHWMFLADWQRSCPDAVTWAAPGLRRRRAVRDSPVVLDHDLTQVTPPAWGDAITLTQVPGALGFVESTLFHRPSRTLVLTDLAMNLEPAKLPAPLRPLLQLLGMQGRPPPWLRALVKANPASRAAAAQLLALHPERVVFAHGAWSGQTPEAALRWLT